MLLDKLEYITSLLTGLGIALGGVILGQELTTVLLNIFIGMLVFYIIGLIARIYLRAKVFPIPVEELEEDEEIDEDYELLDEELTESLIESNLEEEEKNELTESITFTNEED